MATSIIYNGKALGFASTTVKLGGKSYVGCKSLNINDEVATGTAMGNGQVGLGRVSGAYTATLDFEMIAHESTRFQAALGQPLSAKAFNANAYQIENPGAGFRRIEAQGVTVQKIDTAFSQGSDGTYDKYTCHVFLPVKRDGRSLVADPQDQTTSIAASLAI